MEHGKRVGLTAAAVKRHHELGVQPFMQWVLSNQFRQLLDNLMRLAELKPPAQAQPDGIGPLLIQPSDRADQGIGPEAIESRTPP